jgi:hypothetical protein
MATGLYRPRKQPLLCLQGPTPAAPTGAAKAPKPSPKSPRKSPKMSPKASPKTQTAKAQPRLSLSCDLKGLAMFLSPRRSRTLKTQYFQRLVQPQPESSTSVSPHLRMHLVGEIGECPIPQTCRTTGAVSLTHNSTAFLSRPYGRPRARPGTRAASRRCGQRVSRERVQSKLKSFQKSLLKEDY